MVSHRCLNDCKFPQVSRSLLNIFTDLNNALVWIVSFRSLISKTSSPCTNFLWLKWARRLQLVIIMTTLSDFFTSASAEGPSLKFERQQVSKSLLDSSQYSGCLDNNAVVWMVSNRPLISKSSGLFISLGDCTKSTNNSWYERPLHAPLFLQFPGKVEISFF